MEQLAATRRLAVAAGVLATAALALTPAAAAPPSRDVTLTAPYDLTRTSSSGDAVATNTRTQEVTATADGLMTTELSASCGVGLCSEASGNRAYANGFAAVGGMHKMRTNKPVRVTVTALLEQVRTSSSTPAAGGSGIGLQVQPGWGGTSKSCHLPLTTPETTYTITCTADAPNGGWVTARTYLTSTVQDELGDDVASTHSATATVRSIHIDVEPLPAA